MVTHDLRSQLGLGSNVTLDTIAVPTEIILWRSTPQTMLSSFLDIYAGQLLNHHHRL